MSKQPQFKRRATVKKTAKFPCLCQDGPFWGATLYLDEHMPATAIFTVRGETGRYVDGKWESV